MAKIHPTMESPPAFVLDPGSTTSKLQPLAKDFGIEIRSNGVSMATAFEKQHFNLEGPLFAREVMIKGNRQPWMLARSVCTLTPQQRPTIAFFETLHDTPLGIALDAHKAVRGPIEAQLLSLNSPIMKEHFHYSFTSNQDVWMRWSYFVLLIGRVFLSEVFLPDFPLEERL